MDLLDPQPPKEYAGFWMRFVARIIDQLIIGMIAGIFIVPIALISGLSLSHLDFEAMDDSEKLAAIMPMLGLIGIIIIIALVADWLYYALQESSAQQATIGKRVFNIIVTDLDGNRISFGRATGRHFGKIISGMIMNIGFIMAAFTEKKQALHDIMANCVVVKKRIQMP